MAEARAAAANMPRGRMDGGGGGGHGGRGYGGEGLGGRGYGGRPGPYDRNIDRYGGGGGGAMRHAGHMRRRGVFLVLFVCGSIFTFYENVALFFFTDEPYMRGGDHWGVGGGGGPQRYMEPAYERPRTLKTLYAEDVGSGHRIHMRGLPFRATEDDIAEVFILLIFYIQ